MTERITIIEAAPALDVFYELQNARPDLSEEDLQVQSGVSAIRSGSKFRPGLRYNPGGKGINVARVLSRLLEDSQKQVEVSLHLFCRDDPLTSALDGLLEAERRLRKHVRIIRHPIGARQPRVCANAVITDRGRMTHEFNFSPHMDIDERDRKRMLDLVGSAQRDGDWVVLAGTSPAFGQVEGLDPLFHHDAIARLERTKIMLDTSGPALDRCLAADFDQLKVIKINRREADRSQAALEKFPGVRVVTSRLGAEIHDQGSRLGQARIEQYPQVRCTLGAGDAMTAGFLLRHLETGDPLESALFGQAVSLALVSSKSGIRSITARKVARHLGHLDLH